jgi:hypothetical protein
MVGAGDGHRSLHDGGVEPRLFLEDEFDGARVSYATRQLSDARQVPSQRGAEGRKPPMIRAAQGWAQRAGGAGSQSAGCNRRATAARIASIDRQSIRAATRIHRPREPARAVDPACCRQNEPGRHSQDRVQTRPRKPHRLRRDRRSLARILCHNSRAREHSAMSRRRSCRTFENRGESSARSCNVELCVRTPAARRFAGGSMRERLDSPLRA